MLRFFSQSLNLLLHHFDAHLNWKCVKCTTKCGLNRTNQTKNLAAILYQVKSKKNKFDIMFASSSFFLSFFLLKRAQNIIRCVVIICKNTIPTCVFWIRFYNFMCVWYGVCVCVCRSLVGNNNHNISLARYIDAFVCRYSIVV